jgi:hypothetical protein
MKEGRRSDPTALLIKPPYSRIFLDKSHELRQKRGFIAKGLPFGRPLFCLRLKAQHNIRWLSLVS